MCSIEQLFGWKGGAVAIALTVAPIVTGGYNGSFLFRPPPRMYLGFSTTG